MDVKVVDQGNVLNGIDKILLPVLGDDDGGQPVGVGYLHGLIIIVQEKNLKKPQNDHQQCGKGDEISP